jgi:putative oxidoreductase
MTALITLYNSVFSRIEEALGPWLMPTIARICFASVLLFYYWNSGYQKLGEGLDGLFFPSDGAYVSILPKRMDEVGYDISQLGTLDYLIVFLGTWAELILPLLIVIGLFTRVAALGMIGFVIVQSYVDVVGHGIDTKTFGSFFDGQSNGLVADQRFLWIFLLLLLVVRGAGPISVDAIRPRAIRTIGIKTPRIV